VIQELFASLVFGAALLVLGGFLIRWHIRTWREQRGDNSLDDGERRFSRAQFRRRFQIALLLMFLGGLIPLADYLMTARLLSNVSAALLILGLLAVALWIMLLAALDWLSSRVQQRAARLSLARLERQRRELEDEVTRMREHLQNGHG
jgi:drug/metabolite transporter (DMT)-like permease